MDDCGRDVLGFIDGYVPWEPAQQALDAGDECLAGAAALMRQFHDLTAGTDLAGTAEVVCHNDLSPDNTVYRDEGMGLRPVAFLDWDLAAPGARIHDLAHVCWQFPGLGSRVTDVAQAARQLRLICDSYQLLAADGLTGPQIARRVGCTEPTVIKWRRQYAEDGLAGLADALRPGGPTTVLTDAAIAEILSATVTPPPGTLQAAGVTHWSSRRLADWLRRQKKVAVSHDSITRLWRRFCLQPHRTEGFKFSTDPQLEVKITDVVGLYLHPPENAVVVCVDEKSQVQALERSQPILPMRHGIPQRQTHDYARHGVTCLFAALNTATSQVTDACYPRHRHQEFLRFLKKVAGAYPGTDLHVVCDNYATHKHAYVKAWLARNPRVTLHFTPTGCSWLNLVPVNRALGWATRPGCLRSRAFALAGSRLAAAIRGMGAMLRVVLASDGHRVEGCGLDGELVNRFLAHLGSRAFSPATVRAYAYDLLNFLRFLASRNARLADVVATDLFDYLDWQQHPPGRAGRTVVRLGAAGGAMPATMNRRIAAVRGLFEFAVMTGARADNPVPAARRSSGLRAARRGLLGHVGPGRPRSGGRLVRQPRLLPESLEPDDVTAFLANLRTFRDRAITLAMLLGGLRAAEVRSLRLAEVDMGMRRLRVTGKGGKERVVPVDGAFFAELAAYLRNERPAGCRTPECFVVLRGPTAGQPLTEAGLRRIFRTHRLASGALRVRPHRLRHTYGTELASAGIDLLALRELMGHANPETTAAYVHLSPETLAAEYARARAAAR